MTTAPESASGTSENRTGIPGGEGVHRDPLHGIPLTRGGFDRRAELRADASLCAELLARADTLVIPVAGGAAPMTRVATGMALAWRAPQEGDAAHLSIFLGVAQDRPHLALVLPQEERGQQWLGLRESGADLGDTDAQALTVGVALANWHGSHTHCPRCGSPTQPANAGWTRHCPRDDSEHFPRTDPAIIVAITDPDDRLLLARHPAWPQGRLSVLAGFVEPGETLAMTVAREVYEEVGLRVHDIRYLADQPWPFPGSLMLGFSARAAQTALTLDPREIAEAQWVSREDYRRQVDEGAWAGGGALSISRRLIHHWLTGQDGSAR